jgi:signal transduction histidine kinase
VQSETFDLALLVRNCVEGYQAAHPGYRIVPNFSEAPVLILGVPDRIAQMLDKLIDNAIQFGSENGLIIVNLRRDAEFIELSVLNDGPSLPDDIADRLFDPMVSSTKDARKTHLGLGLYIVRLVAESHRGTVRAENRRGSRGVEVTVALPVEIRRRG